MSASEEIVVIDGARTPIGGFDGAFKDVPAHEFGAAAARAAITRYNGNPRDIGEVVMGCIGQVGRRHGDGRQRVRDRRRRRGCDLGPAVGRRGAGPHRTGHPGGGVHRCACTGAG